MYKYMTPVKGERSVRPTTILVGVRNWRISKGDLQYKKEGVQEEEKKGGKELIVNCPGTKKVFSFLLPTAITD